MRDDESALNGVWVTCNDAPYIGPTADSYHGSFRSDVTTALGALRAAGAIRKDHTGVQQDRILQKCLYNHNLLSRLLFNLPFLPPLLPPPCLLPIPRMQGPAILPNRLLLIFSLALTVAAQHDHGHPHHGKVKSEWDEEEYLKLNPPTPPSYWSEDTRMRMSPDEVLPARYPWLVVLHVLFMSGAFFVALPVGE